MKQELDLNAEQWSWNENPSDAGTRYSYFSELKSSISILISLLVKIPP
jgi:hypothetical protein